MGTTLGLLQNTGFTVGGGNGINSVAIPRFKGSAFIKSFNVISERPTPLGLELCVNFADRWRVKVHRKDQMITFKILCILLQAELG